MDSITSSNVRQKVWDALWHNLNVQFKRIEADTKGSHDVYENILSRPVLDALQNETRHIFKDWGTVIKNTVIDEDGVETKIREVIGGSYNGRVIPVGLRWTRSHADWIGKNKDSQSKKVRLRDNRGKQENDENDADDGYVLVGVRPQIVVTARPVEIYDELFRPLKKGGLYLTRIGKAEHLDHKKIHPGVPIWNDFQIMPLRIYLPTFGKISANVRYGGGRYNVHPTDRSRHYFDSSDLSDEHRNIFRESDDEKYQTLISIGREIGLEMLKKGL
jgi:hypothetical protein